jgi:uncharacterized protein (TIGR02246 family)
MTLSIDRIRGIADAYTAAWNTGSAHAVAEFYSEAGRIAINRGPDWEGRRGIAEMAQGFFTDVPDLRLACDELRIAGDHVAYFWTFTGTHAGSRRPLRVSGWEEWDLGPDLKIMQSRGWFDAANYARQTGEG